MNKRSNMADKWPSRTTLCQNTRNGLRNLLLADWHEKYKSFLALDFSSPTFLFFRSDFPSLHYLHLGLRGWLVSGITLNKKMLLNSARVKLVMIELLKCKTVHVKTIGIAHIFFDCMLVVTGCPTLMVKRSQAGLPRAECDKFDNFI